MTVAETEQTPEDRDLALVRGFIREMKDNPSTPNREILEGKVSEEAYALVAEATARVTVLMTAMSGGGLEHWAEIGAGCAFVIGYQLHEAQLQEQTTNH